MDSFSVLRRGAKARVKRSDVRLRLIKMEHIFALPLSDKTAACLHYSFFNGEGYEERSENFATPVKHVARLVQNEVMHVQNNVLSVIVQNSVRLTI